MAVFRPLDSSGIEVMHSPMVTDAATFSELDL